MGHVLWRSAFQARHPHLALPGTAYPVTIAQTVIGSRARGGRVTPVGRPRLGRGAFEPRARGDENQGGRNDFLRFQEQLLRRKKRELFLGVSVGNGVAGG